MSTHESTASEGRALALAVVGAPLLWLVAEALSPALKSDVAQQLAVVAQDSGRWYAYTFVLMLGTVLFLPAIAGIARLTRHRMPRLTLLGATLLGYGTAVAVGDVMSQFTLWVGTEPGLDRAQVSALLTRVDDSGGLGAVYGPGGLSFLVGTVLLSVALARCGEVPVWSGILLGVGIVLQLVGFIASSIPALTLSAVLVLVALLPVARSLMTSHRASALT